MSTWKGGLRKVAIVIILLVAVLAGGAHWLCNRSVAPVEPQELASSYARSLAWVKANEAHVLGVGNSALWWMVLTTADITGDTYLRGLAEQVKQRLYVGEEAGRAWKRMFDPKAEVYMGGSGPMHLMAPYQRFFYHALTCVPVEYPGADSVEFLNGNVCRPIWKAVLLTDAACTTHQLMGLQIFKRTGCQAPHPLMPLEQELLDDIEWQLTVDPVMKDAYIQRVLVLAWQGQGQRIKPIWLRRILDAQESDGGWLGHRRVPELPDWLSPWAWREHLASRWPNQLKSERQAQDFHATAQAMLLLALMQNAAPAKAQHSYNASHHQETGP